MGEKHRLGAVLREGLIDIVVNERNQADFGGEIQDAVESGVLQARDLAGNFGEYAVDKALELSYAWLWRDTD